MIEQFMKFLIGFEMWHVNLQSFDFHIICHLFNWQEIYLLAMSSALENWRIAHEV